MVALKVNRTNLLEITEITIRCTKCRHGSIIGLAKGYVTTQICPSCGNQFGKHATNAFSYLQEARIALKNADNAFTIEFDIVD